MSVSEINELYMNYVPIPKISELSGMSIPDVYKCVEFVKEARARLSMEAVDLTEYVDELPVVKMLITKLSIMRAELFRRAYNDFHTLTLAEKVDNMIKRVKINDASEWVASEADIEVIEETGGYVTSHWIFQAESTTSKELVEQADTLTKKMLMKPEQMFVVVDSISHAENCKKWDCDPKTTSEATIQGLEEDMKKITDGGE